MQNFSKRVMGILIHVLFEQDGTEVEVVSDVEVIRLDHRRMTVTFQCMNSKEYYTYDANDSDVEFYEIYANENWSKMRNYHLVNRSVTSIPA